MDARYHWFWSFWHWCREGHRTGMLLESPLEDLGSHWEEWYTHEAGDNEKAAIEAIAEDPQLQTGFIAWLEAVWQQEAFETTNHLVVPYVLGELHGLAPFSDWRALKAGALLPRELGVAAVVLAEGSQGEASDVRPLETLVLSERGRTRQGRSITKGFHIPPAELEHVRSAVESLFVGPARRRLFFRWWLTLSDEDRSWRGWLEGCGWACVAGGVLLLLYGPDPGALLPGLALGLVSVWLYLVVAALFRVVRSWRRFSAAGRELADRLRTATIHFGMECALTVKGGSAGLAFGLGVLRAIGRAWPDVAGKSLVWMHFLGALQGTSSRWAATGVLTAEGALKPVQLGCKSDACARKETITDLLVPRSGIEEPKSLRGDKEGQVKVRVHRCSDLVDALTNVGRLKFGAGAVRLAFTATISLTVLAGLGDLVRIIFPPAEPAVTSPASPHPYSLWVTLDTSSPRFFQVVLESNVWANRRVDVKAHDSAPASVRAEIRLLRRTDIPGRDLEEGLVWIERRPCFLFREFEPGERVGRYTLSYINRLRHE